MLEARTHVSLRFVETTNIGVNEQVMETDLYLQIIDPELVFNR
jgi:hypothetical protein